MDIKLTDKWKIEVFDLTHSHKVQQWLFDNGWEWNGSGMRVENYTYTFIYSYEFPKFKYKSYRNFTDLTEYNIINPFKKIWI